MDTITRLITIMTKQNGYMIYAEDFFAVSNMCYAIAGILFVIGIGICIVMRQKETRKQLNIEKE